MFKFLARFANRVIKAFGRLTRMQVWDKHNQERLESHSHKKDQTKSFFDHIPIQHQQKFNSSSKRVIQIGIGTGAYIGNNCSSKSVIGYDFSKTAIASIEEKGYIGRLLDLGELHPKNKRQLAYHDLLRKDLAVPAEIVMIRVLEYLNPEAVKLLILSMIDLAKPDSKFYFDIWNGHKRNKTDLLGNLCYFPIEHGYIPSFFAARTDVEFLSYGLCDLANNENVEQDEKCVERLIVRKYR